jgi:hypothetical protein
MEKALPRRRYPTVGMASVVLMINACSRSRNPEVALVVSHTTQAFIAKSRGARRWRIAPRESFP